MYFELQLSAAVFARVVRNRLRALDLCVDRSVPDPLGGGMLVVDQVIVGEATTIQREQAMSYPGGVPTLEPSSTQAKWAFTDTGNLFNFTVPFVQVRQDVMIELVRESDLVANGVAASEPARKIALTVVLNVALTNGGLVGRGGPLTLTYTLAYFDYGEFGGLLTDAQRAEIDQILSGIRIEPTSVDLGFMTRLLDRPVAAINSGLACDPAGTRVALRVDFDVFGSSFDVRREFFTDGPVDLLAGRDWAMLMDADALIHEAEPMVRDALEQPSMRRLSDPVARWDAAATTLHVEADVRLLAACPGFVEDIDLDVHVDLAARYSVPAPDMVSVHYQLGHRFTDTGQVFGCALTAAVLYPFAGVALLDKKKIGVFDYLGGVAFGPFFAFGQLIGVINAQKLEQDISDSLKGTCHKINDAEYECTTVVTQAVQLLPGRTSFLRVEAVSGVPDGVVLAGPVSRLDELETGVLRGIQVESFAWRVRGRCNANRDGRGSFATVNSAAIGVDVAAPSHIALPARVCSARILSDRLGVFTLQVSGSELTVDAKVTPEYRADPYPCRVRVVTNRGTRTIDLGTAKARSARDDAALDASLRQWERLCARIALTTLPFDELFTVPTEPPPPMEVLAVDHWLLSRRLTVTGLADSARLALRAAGIDESDVDVRVSTDGTAHLSAITVGTTPSIPTSLEVELIDGDRPLAEHSITQQQILYAQRAQIPSGGAPGTLRLVPRQSGTLLVVGGADCDQDEAVWDLAVPTRPLVLEDRRDRHGAPEEAAHDAVGPPHTVATSPDGSLHARYEPGSRSIHIYEAVRVSPEASVNVTASIAAVQAQNIPKQ